jgi:hypothetical protein
MQALYLGNLTRTGHVAIRMIWYQYHTINIWPCFKRNGINKLTEGGERELRSGGAVLV